MMDCKIIKRNGELVNFDKTKVVNAINLASQRTEKGIDEELSLKIADSIEKNLKKKTHIEQIESWVEDRLMSSSRKDIAREYIGYRRNRQIERSKVSDIVHNYTDIIDANNPEILKENGNLNGDSLSGQKTKTSAENDKWYALNFVLPKYIAQAHTDRYVHVHDLDWLQYGMQNCLQIDMPEILSRGFSTGNGSVRRANSIQTACSLIAIIMQSVQNCQYGGVGGASVDKALSEFVKISFVKNFKKGLEYVNDTYHTVPKDEDIYMDNVELQNNHTMIYKFALSETILQTKQGAESLIHNLNTMNSRSGSQTPFSSINYGLDASTEGRLVTKSLLEATISGLGNHETPVFPIQIFTCKKGINQNTEDPNYDLFKLAIECSSKRLFPNFCNVDAPYNLKFYDPDDYRTAVVTMGCRTRVIADRFGKNRVTGKGNLAFSSLNLPLIALESVNMNDFMENVAHYMDIARDSLLFRYRLICKNPAKAFDFIMREGVWEGGETLNQLESAEELFKHGSLSIGFVGLAEALKYLTEFHHGESKESQKLGLELISYMRSITDKYSEEHNLNFSLFATPAESLAGGFGRHNQKKHGIIEGVTDREYITNSSHVPVYYPISIKDKIDIEAPYHELCNAGHIGYIELDGNARNNLDAFESVVKYALEKDMTYFSVNHPVDFCPNCKYEGIIGDECPNCHTTEDETHFMRWRRLTGYLTGTLDRFNGGKRAEEKDRVKHG